MTASGATTIATSVSGFSSRGAHDHGLELYRFAVQRARATRLRAHQLVDDRLLILNDLGILQRGGEIAGHLLGVRHFKEPLLGEIEQHQPGRAVFSHCRRVGGIGNHFPALRHIHHDAHRRAFKLLGLAPRHGTAAAGHHQSHQQK